MWESAGIVISVAFSMVLVIYRSSRPHIDILGRLPGSTTYRSVRPLPPRPPLDLVRDSADRLTSARGLLHPNTPVYRNVKRFPQALVIPRMVILRLDAALYFANIGAPHPPNSLWSHHNLIPCAVVRVRRVRHRFPEGAAA